MNKTQQMKRRPLTAMPGHALALSGLQHAADKRDAQRMGAYLRMTVDAQTVPRWRTLLAMRDDNTFLLVCLLICAAAFSAPIVAMLVRGAL